MSTAWDNYDAAVGTAREAEEAAVGKGMAQRVTFATLRGTDGASAHYQVYRGILRKDGRINYSSRRTVLVGNYHMKGEGCYPCMEQVNATTEAPAVPWDSHKEHVPSAVNHVSLEIREALARGREQ